jgi:hypothetical protein
LAFGLLATIIHITGKSSHYSFYFSSYINLFYKNKTTIDLFHSFIIVLTLYFLSSTTVHPWYIINLILRCIYKIQISNCLSLVVILSYSAYVNPIQRKLLAHRFRIFCCVCFFNLWKLELFFLEKQYIWNTYTNDYQIDVFHDRKIK